HLIVGVVGGRAAGGRGDRVRLRAPDVRGTAAVGVGGGDDEVELDVVAAPLGGELGGRDGKLDERRQRRALFPAGGAQHHNEYARLKGSRSGGQPPRSCDSARRSSAPVEREGFSRAAVHRMYRDRSSFFTMSASIFVT